MGKFRGRLTRETPYNGVQCVLYTPENEKVDIDVTDEKGYYFFEGIPEGNYEVRFFGRGYTAEDWISITIVENFGVAEVGSLFIRSTPEPNQNNWFKDTVTWNLDFDSEAYEAEYKVWDVAGTEPSSWTSWDGTAQQITSTGKWKVKARISPTDSSVITAEEESDFLIDLGDPQWNPSLDPTDPANPDLIQIVGGFGALNVQWNPNANSQTFSSGITSFSGDHTVIVKASTTVNYADSFEIGEFSEDLKKWQYSDINKQKYYIWLDLKNQAGNVATKAYHDDVPHYILSLVPSNLNDELTILDGSGAFIDTEVTPNVHYYRTLYGLSSRTDTIELTTSVATTLSAVEYMDPDGVWTSVVNPTIDNSALTLPFNTQGSGFNHIIKFDKVDTKGVRIIIDDVTKVDYFNVVESLAAETFIGQTFEAQRGIAFLANDPEHPDHPKSAITMDNIGIRGWYDRDAEDPTFELTLGGDFKVGSPDSYLRYNNTTGEMTLVGTFKQRTPTHDPAPDPIYMGYYDPLVTYYGGDIVGYTPDDTTYPLQQYIYTGATTQGTAPTDANNNIQGLWELYGVAGAPGENAKSLRLNADSQTFTFDGDGNPDPTSQTITFTAKSQNIGSTNPTWSTVPVGIGAVDGTDPNKYKITVSDLGANSSVVVKVEKETLSDQMTVVRLNDGSDSLTSFLTNETHTIASDSDGGSLVLTGAETSMRIFKGLTELTDDSGWTYTISATTGGVTANFKTGDPNTVEVTAMTDSVGTVTITASHADYPDQIRVFTLTKSKQGVQGDKGADGWTVDITADGPYTRAYNSDGAISVATSKDISFTADVQNGTGTESFAWYLEGTPVGTNSSTYTYTWPDTMADPKKVVVEVTDGGVIKARDQVTLQSLQKGGDAITVSMTNEAHSVSVNQAGTPDFSGSENEITVFLGAQQLSYDNDGITPLTFDVTHLATGITANPLARTVGDLVVGYGQPSSFTDSTASILYTITAIDDEGNTRVIKKKQTFSKSIHGQDGNPSKSLRLKADAQTFTYDGDGNLSPAGQEITLTAFEQNLDSTEPVWTTTPDNGATPVGPIGATSTTNPNIHTITASDFGSLSRLTVKAYKDGVEDEITIVRLVDGSDVIVSVLTNEAHTLPADEDGNVTSGSYAAAKTSMIIYKGLEDVTSQWAISKVDSINLDSTLVGSEVTINDMTSDSGTVTLEGAPPTGTTFPAQSKVFTLTKSRQGVTGTSGDPAWSVDITSTKPFVQAYKSDGTLDAAASIVLDANVSNADEAITYKWYVNDGTTPVATAAQYAYEWPTGAIPDPVSIRVEVYNSDGSLLKAEDQVTLHGLKQGSSAVTISLSNEAHSIPVDKGGTSDYSDSGTSIRAYLGAQELVVDTSASPGNLTFDVSSVTAPDITPDSSPTRVNNATSIVYGEAGNMTAGVKVAYIDFTIDVIDDEGNTRTFVKRQTFSKAFAGQDGSKSKTLQVTATAQSFTFNGDGDEDPANQEIIFTANGQNLDGSEYTWTTDPLKSDGSTPRGELATTNTNKYKWKLSASDFGDLKRIKVTASRDGYSDQITVVRLVDGTDSVTSYLTNESHILPAGSNGAVGSYAGAATAMKIFKGAVEEPDYTTLTGGWTFTYNSSDPTDLTFTPSDNTFQIDNMADSLDVGTISVLAQKEGYPDQNKVFTVSKGKQGERGIQGPKGSTGPGIVYRGLFDASKTYFYTAERRDVVHISDGSGGLNYYLTTPNGTSGASTWEAPPGNGTNNHWEPFGAQFTSIATGVLFTQDATVTRSLIMGSEADHDPNGEGGLIRSANLTVTNGNFTDRGFFLGYNNPKTAYEFFVGQKDYLTEEDKYLHWDGSQLELKGKVNIDEGNVLGDLAVSGTISLGGSSTEDPTVTIGNTASVPAVKSHKTDTIADLFVNISSGSGFNGNRKTVMGAWKNVATGKSNITVVMLYNVSPSSGEDVSYTQVEILGRNGTEDPTLIAKKTYGAGESIQEKQFIIGNTFDYDQITSAVTIVTSRYISNVDVPDVSNADVYASTGDANIILKQQSSSIALNEDGLYQRIDADRIVPYGSGGAGGAISVDSTNFTVNWTDIAGTPTEFPPSAHNHAASEINSGTLALARIPSIPNSKLSNSTISGVSLGSNLATLSSGTGITMSNYNGSAARSIAVTNPFNPSGTYSGLRAQATTKGDVGLGSVDNYSRAHYDARYVLESQMTDNSINPVFASQIGFGNDGKVIEHIDSNNQSGAGWTGKDAIKLYGDGNISNLALYVGHLHTLGASEIQGALTVGSGVDITGSLALTGSITNGSITSGFGSINIGASSLDAGAANFSGLITAGAGVSLGNFKVEYNSTTDSLDFNYTG